MPCVLFVAREIFPVFQKWRYYEANTRIQIGKTGELMHALLFKGGASKMPYLIFGLVGCPLVGVCLTPQHAVILQDDNSSVKMISVSDPLMCKDVCCQTVSSLVCNK